MEMKADVESEVMEQLYALEPIFHHAAVGAGREDFEAITSPDFWEVGPAVRCTTVSSWLTLLLRGMPGPTTIRGRSATSKFASSKALSGS